MLKNPAVDTSFLPDRERDTRERQEREDLRRQWLKDQETLKNEDVEITYSYWDGAGHRRVVKCKKGDDIAVFLEKCRQQFPELRGTSVDNLMYIKEDLIIPHVSVDLPFSPPPFIALKLTLSRALPPGIVRSTTPFTTSSSTRRAASRARSSTSTSTMTSGWCTTHR